MVNLLLIDFLYKTFSQIVKSVIAEKSSLKQLYDVVHKIDHFFIALKVEFLQVRLFLPQVAWL